MLNNFTHFNKFILRLPHNPLNKAFDAFNSETLLKEGPMLDSFFLESIFIASSDVYNAITNIDKLSEKKRKKLEATILKYRVRCATRCTPFGQFSGVSLGHFGNKTEVKTKVISKSINLNYRLLKAFSGLILESYKINDKIIFYPNSTIYRILDEIRYLEYDFKNETETFTLQRINYNNYINEILNFTKNGKTFNQIHCFLKGIMSSEKKNINNGLLIEFIEKIINSQLLVSNLEPIIIGENYFYNIINISINSNYSNKLLSIKKILNSIKISNNSTLKGYQKITKTKENLLPNYTDQNIFHTDLIYKFKTNTLNSSVPKKLKKAIFVIQKLCPKIENNFIQKFKKEFLYKYSTNEVPISILFDNEVGLDFFKNNNIDYIENLNLNTNPFKYLDNPNTEFLLRKLESVFKKNKNVLELYDEEIINLKNNDSLPFHNTFSCFIEVYKNPNYIFISDIGGSSAANYFSRFSTEDSSIALFTQKIIKKEKQLEKNKIIAEIIHSPESKNSNVINRKIERDYVINYLSNSSTLKNNILISDLSVKIKKNKIILKSKRLNKEIIPVLTSAHNYNISCFPLYKFLCSLQDQNATSVSFYWGNYFRNHNFLPRVCYKNFILSKAQWVLKYDELKSVSNINNFRANKKLPRYIQLEQYDKYLLIDLDSKLSFDILLSYSKKRKIVTVIEFLFNNENGLTIDNQIYSNEYIISYYKNER